MNFVDDGRQSIDLAGSHPGEILQSFETIPDVPYLLSFAFASNTGAPSPRSATVTVEGSGLLLSRTVTHFGSTFQAMNYTSFAEGFVADSPTTTLRFTEHAGDSFFGIVLDSVSVVPGVLVVPEP